MWVHLVDEFIKKWDKAVHPHIRQGFEMLVNNFSAGILGGLLALLGVIAIGPLVGGMSAVLQTGVDWIVKANLLPLAYVFIEPAKVLFLNNAINQGILTPLGIQQAAETGKSILFLLEPNPGPGLGMLLAFTFFGRCAAKAAAPGAIIIQFLGGIHKIYFPYILSKPALLPAVIAGGATGTATFQLLGAGLKATPSPGSIFAVLLMTPKGVGSFIAVLAGVLSATVVSFIISVIILRRSQDDDLDIEAAQAESTARKAESKGKGVRPTINNNAAETTETGDNYIGAYSDEDSNLSDYSHIQQIIFACEAGMGSSAMGASLLRDRIKKSDMDIPVTNLAIRNLKAGSDTLVLTQNELADMAAQKAPDALRVALDNFLTSPKHDEIVMNLKSLQIEQQEYAQSETHTQIVVDNIDDIDWSAVKQVDFIHHDQRRGTSTIATSELNNRLQGTDVKASSTPIGQLTDDYSELVISTEEAIANVKLRFTNVQILKVDSIIDMATLDEVAKRLGGKWL